VDSLHLDKLMEENGLHQKLWAEECYGRLMNLTECRWQP